MKLAQTDQGFLEALGVEAADMLVRFDYSGLAARFGYALSYGREPAEAIKTDYMRAAASPLDANGRQPVVVKYFKPNSTGLFALVECVVPTSSGAAVLLELVVTGEAEKHITIEDISGAAE